MPVLSIVLPCYNEEAVLPSTIEKINKYLNDLIEKEKISPKSFLCFVDDGSTDNTWSIIEKHQDNQIRGLKLAANAGHQNALLAGLIYNRERADIFITIDADLQDDINAIEKMVDSYLRGNEIVYGVRESREVDTPFKRKSAELFYDIQDKIGIKIIKNHADFRLISKKVLVHLEEFTEVNLYLRAMFPIIGFKSDHVYYKREERLAGESKYPLIKMLSLAWEGITSFSTFPLKLITIIGTLIFIISIFMILYTIYLKLFTDLAIQGWASTEVAIYFIGGVQLLSLGVLGEYLGKVYKETKRRPRFIVEKST